ncbi:MAG: MFS transporter [Chloroflexi bacterium]|nr:MFS transporter [Chloroflexota bacterium]
MERESGSTKPGASPTDENLWRNADFLKLWSAQTVSVTGSLLGALQFTAILTLDATALQMSALTAAGVLPALLFGFVIGAWVDRLKRRPILISADLLRMALLGSIPVAWHFDALSIEQVYAVAFLHGLLTIFFDVAYRSYLPALVSQRKLVEANSRLSATASVAEIGGFSLGGWIAQAFSAIVATAVDSATFLVSAALVVWIRRVEPTPTPSKDVPNIRREIMEGLRIVIGNPVLRSIGVSKASLGLASGIIGSLIVLFGIETLGFSPGVLGTIFAIGGVSSILGALSVGNLTRHFGLGRTLTAGFLIWGLTTILIPLAHGPLLLAGAFLAAEQLFDFGVTIYEVTEMSLRQRITPYRMLGRVNASMEVTLLGAQLAGAILGGVLAELAGIRWALAVASCLLVAGGIWLLFSPVWKMSAVPNSDTG